MVEVNNLTKEKLPISRLKQLAQKVGGDRDISVAFLLPKEIALLNARYRNKQESTDVLSFEGSGDYLGEVLICPQVVKQRSQEYNFIYEKEIERVLVHGILHLLGYDHQTKKEKEKMKSLEEHYLFC